MPAAKTRSLKPAEARFIDQVLLELRLHFKEWTSNYRSEHNLISFAIYEGCSGSGCCGAILNKTAPFALGKHLVENNGFKWAMALRDGEWRYAIRHDAIAEPFELAEIATGKWNRKRYKYPPEAVELVNGSCDYLAGLARWAADKSR